MTKMFFYDKKNYVYGGNHRDNIHFEFLNCNQTLNEGWYSQQLQCVHENLTYSQYLSIEEMYFSMIMQGHIQQEL